MHSCARVAKGIVWACVVLACISACGADATTPPTPDSPIIDSAPPIDSVPSVDRPLLTDASVIDASVIDASVIDGPVIDGPVIDGPLTDGPLTDGPPIDGPLVDAASDASPDAFICVCVTPGPCELGPGTCDATGHCVYTTRPAGTVCRAAAGP